MINPTTGDNKGKCHRCMGTGETPVRPGSPDYRECIHCGGSGWVRMRGLTAMIDPDCRGGKHASCTGGPCQCGCHNRESVGVID